MIAMPTSTGSWSTPSPTRGVVGGPAERPTDELPEPVLAGRDATDEVHDRDAIDRALANLAGGPAHRGGAALLPEPDRGADGRDVAGGAGHGEEPVVAGVEGDGDRSGRLSDRSSGVVRHRPEGASMNEHDLVQALEGRAAEVDPAGPPTGVMIGRAATVRKRRTAISVVAAAAAVAVVGHDAVAGRRSATTGLDDPTSSPPAGARVSPTRWPCCPSTRRPCRSTTGSRRPIASA